MTHDKTHTPDTQLVAEVKTDESKVPYIGMVANYADSDETRVLLTPEACGLLTASDHVVAMEAGAGVDVSFSDADYAEYGVKIMSREEVLKSDVVLSYAPLRASDVRHMRKGATLLCMMDTELINPGLINALLEQHVTLGCLDNMYSHNDEQVFANIIDEIDGRAAVMYAQEHLSYLGGGKGVLLAGVAGINPCEVLIFGEGVDVEAAAMASLAAGAHVTVLNNDISALQRTQQVCGPNLTTLAIHPKVLSNKMRTADVIFMGTTTRPFEIPTGLRAVMKPNVYELDFKEAHPAVSVPRTVAMAISNVLVNFFGEMMLKGNFEGMLSTSEGVQAGIVTYRGCMVDKLLASYLGMQSVDISVMLAGGSAN